MDNPKRQIVDANLITEFGGIEDFAAFQEEGVAQRDYTYVPGFSEMRVNRDLDLGKLARNEIRAKEVSTLPVNVRWFRTVKGTGNDPDQMRAAHAKNAGYRPVTDKDIGQAWLGSTPPGGLIAPDGTIRSAAGDLALYVIDQQGAAKNAYRKKQATEAMVDGMEMASGGLGVVGKTVRGADPVISKEVTK